VSSKLLSDVCYLAQVAPSGDAYGVKAWCGCLEPLVFGNLFARAKPCCWLYLAGYRGNFRRLSAEDDCKM